MSSKDINAVADHLAQASLAGINLTFAGRGLKLDSDKDGMFFRYSIAGSA